MEKENNYPLGMHPPIGAYLHPKNKDEWEHCPKCGFQPRVWEFGNGRYTHCGCSNSTYDHFSVTAKTITDVMKENGGDTSSYDPDELRKNWNKYCKNHE